MDAFERAQRRREEIRKELEEIDLFLRLHQKFSGGTVPEQDIVATSPDGTMTVLEAKTAPAPTRNLSKHKMAKQVMQFMYDRKYPMTRTDIVEALELKGIPVAGVDKARAIGTIMWRLRDRFVNLPGYGYWPIDQNFEPAGYRAKEDHMAPHNAPFDIPTTTPKADMFSEPENSTE
ncbi:hypothetical protein [Mesorhizobium sp. CA4]|uniref:hypothetical protein n=1 Tax=Mesorhizobium sp. CA4 TaxID=588499 RepID=UPI001CD181A1|nr:hypothetical protein [Mesorhizobium sp. CA4]MBZ9822368.1 hypothetical protein [Mesorhizobium sp. CA4]